MIGHIANKASANTFSDFLYVQGITNVIEQEKEGWAVWIHSEDELEKARSLLSGYLQNPSDPKYEEHARKADKIKQQELEAEEESAKKYFDRERTFRTTLPYGLGPLTAVLILASVVVTFMSTFQIGERWLNLLRFSQYMSGAPEILNGQVWRLITPIFFHASLLIPFGFLHLFFNALWLYSLGSVVEHRHGTRWLLVFILVVAALSNLGQYLVSGPLFGGLSGVVYALLGYIWIKGKLDPDAGLALHPQTVSMMLIWFFLCLFQVIPGIANTVHAIGLIAGMAWAYFSTLSNT